jgi:hypothetical protein
MWRTLCGGVVLSLLVLWALAGAAQAEAPCANEGLRQELRSGELPDCRAYELVSPPYKEGAVVFASARAPDGSRVIVQSLGAFAGAENDEFGGTTLGASYLLTRAGAGWTAAALDPPVTQFAHDEFLAASGDLGASLWNLRTSSQLASDVDLYLRPADGAFAHIGVAKLPGASTNFVYRGAAGNLSSVLFSLSGGPLWPGDTTEQGGSLYEYTGTGNTSPELVGVQGGNGSTTLLSQCGTDLGSAESSDAYNAVSADGATVYFTARHSGEPCAGMQPPADELFARVDRSQTVAISEPSPLDCPACNTVTPEEAQFRGASEDGSKAFFTTNQPLLGEDTSTNLYEYDFRAAGSKVKRLSVGGAAAQVQGVSRVCEDGSHVYFVAAGVLTTQPNAERRVAEGGADNLYLYERDASFPNGGIKFVATLSEGDSEDWSGRDERPVQATPDGRFLVFASRAHLTPDDTSSEGLAQLFEYDAATGSLTRISIGHDGYNANGNIEIEADVPSILPPGFAEVSSSTFATNAKTVSDDGAYVFFQSNERLAPQALSGDPNSTGVGHPNVYEYHAGNVDLVSDGQDTATVDGEPGVQLHGTTSSGSDVFFTTSDALVPQDGDTEQDLYDARIDGGFAPPPAAAACAGEDCQGPPSAPPALLTAGSATFNGPGNLTPPAPTAVKPKPLTNAQKLAKALKACRSKHDRHKRTTCEKQARKRYGPKSKSRRG